MSGRIQNNDTSMFEMKGISDNNKMLVTFRRKRNKFTNIDKSSYLSHQITMSPTSLSLSTSVNIVNISMKNKKGNVEINVHGIGI